GNSNLRVDVAMKLYGGAAGSKMSDLATQVVFINLDNTSAPLHIFQYSDFNLSGSPSNDQVSSTTGGGGGIDMSITQTNGTVTMTDNTVGPRSLEWQAAPYPQLLDSLNDGSPTTLNNTIGFGMSDATYARQGNFTLAPAGPLGSAVGFSSYQVISAATPALPPSSLLHQINQWQAAINQPITDLRTITWDGNVFASLGQILTGGITFMSDQFNKLTGNQKQSYQYLLNAAYSFRDSAKTDIQTALKFYNSGNTAAARTWLDYALTEASRQSRTEAAADQLATNELGTAYDFVNNIYETSKIAFSLACKGLGGPQSPSSLACGAIGDQLFTATDTMIAGTNGLSAGASRAVSD
ncbi:MAG TPA: hypothetical protein PLO69_13530, partial [Gammaproteobacteria bacterium]|nr:hypothetical protein [Gammaproteobacteria bacterium]